jgi:nicotinate-nucleotide adenylyltransferase
MRMSKPVLVYGGSFDPVHKGHLKIADKIQREWKYEEVWFIPCQESRDGKDLASFDDRMDMLNSAIEEFGNPTFKALDSERLANAQGKMYVLAKYLRKTEPNAEMDFLIGSDAAQRIDSWYEADALRNEFMLLVAQRKGYPEVRLQGAMYYSRPLEYEMSSTTARDQMKTQGISPLLTLGVTEIIRRRNLYV